jgi:hypothetical protein
VEGRSQGGAGKQWRHPMTSRRSVLILALLGATLLGAIVWETRTLNSLRQQLSERDAQRRSLTDKLQTARRRVSANEAANSALATSIVQHTKAGASADRPAPVSDASTANPILFKMREHLRQLQVSGVKATVSLQWGLLLKRLNLPPDQAANFLAIQTAVETKKSNILESADEEDKSKSAPDVVGQINQAYNEANQEVRSLLSPADYPVYKAYSQDNATLSLANDLAGNLPASDALTDNQVEQLTQVMGSASTSDKNGWIVYGTVNWAQAMPQAQAILAPNQYEGFQSLAAQKTAEWRLSQLGRRQAK